MPENYTHQRMAARALKSVTDQPPSPAFLMGSTGPDLLFYHKVVTFGDRYRLPRLGSQMHEARTGAFLSVLVTNARSQQQKDYALGFLCHYAADHWIHPYVVAMTTSHPSWQGDGGHGYLEMAMDGCYYLEDHPGVDQWEPPLHTHAVYALSETDMDEIDSLMRQSIAEVYERDLPCGKIREAINDMRKVKAFFDRPSALKWWSMHLVEKMLHLKGVITSHCYLRQMPQEDFMNRQHRPWGEPMCCLSVDECFEQAVLSGAAYIRGAWQLWQHDMDQDTFESLLGNRSYTSNRRYSSSP